MDDTPRQPSNAASVNAEDENRLAELGYKQELTRNWSLLHNFGVSFSIIVSTFPLVGSIGAFIRFRWVFLCIVAFEQSYIAIRGYLIA